MQHLDAHVQHLWAAVHMPEEGGWPVYQRHTVQIGEPCVRCPIGLEKGRAEAAEARSGGRGSGKQAAAGGQADGASADHISRIGGIGGSGSGEGRGAGCGCWEPDGDDKQTGRIGWCTGGVSRTAAGRR